MNLLATPELIPRFQFTDPVIQQIASALKADLQPDAQRVGFTVNLRCSPRGSSLTTCSTLKQNIQTYSDGLPKHKLHNRRLHSSPIWTGTSLIDLANTGNKSVLLCRLFKQSMQMTPHQYVIRREWTSLQLLADQICRLQMWRSSVALLTKVI